MQSNRLQKSVALFCAKNQKTEVITMPKKSILEQLVATDHEKEKVSAEIEKCQNKQEQLTHQIDKLLTRDRKAERNARTRRLIERGAILEGVFPELIELSNDEVQAFLVEKARSSAETK